MYTGASGGVARGGGYSLFRHLSLGLVDYDRDGNVSPTEVLIYLLLPLGAFLGVLGVYMTLAG